MRKILGFLLGITLLFSCSNEKDQIEEKQLENSSKTVDEGSNNTMEEKLDSSLVSVNVKLRNNINDASLYLERAKVYLSFGKIEEGEIDLARAVKIDSSDITNLLTQADFYLQRGKLNRSLAILEYASKVEPKNSKIYEELSELFLIAKNNKMSLQFADLAVKHDMFSAQAYYLKGYNFMEMGDTTKAISSYQTAVEQDPEFYEAYLELGLLHAVLDDPIAIDYYNNALSIKPEDRNTLYSKGMFEQEHEMYNEAIQTYYEATKQFPDFREAHYNLGYIHMFYLKLYREATRYFTDAIKVDPNYYQAYYNRGYSFELLGDINNAARDYQKALAIQPDYTLAASGFERVTR